MINNVVNKTNFTAKICVALCYRISPEQANKIDMLMSRQSRFSVI